MHKCRECGNDFEGKFCPNCGAKWEDKQICPNCGAKSAVGTRFCAECGHALNADFAEQSSNDFRSVDNSVDYRENTVGDDSRAYAERAATTAAASGAVKEQSGTLAKIYKILRYVPIGLLALYSLLVFAFYAASLAVNEGLVVFGADEYESMGSVYSMIDGLTGISVVLLVFGILNLAYAIVTAVFFFRSDKKNKEIKLFGKFDMTLGEAFAAASVVAYLVFVILAGVAMGQVSGINEDINRAINGIIGGITGSGASFGIAVSGAAPKLVMAFAIIFMVFAAAAVAARIGIGKKYPELWESESAARKENELNRLADCVAPRSVDSNAGTHKAKIANQTGTKPLLYYAYSNKKMQRALCWSFWCMLLTMLATLVFLALNLSQVVSMISPHWILLIGSCAAIAAIALCLVIPVKNWTIEGFRDVVSKRKKHNKGKLGLKRMIAYYIVMAYLTGLTITMSIVFAPLRGYIIAMIFGYVVSAAYIVAAVAVAKRNYAISEYLFGQPGPPPGAEPVVRYDEQSQIEAYENYRSAVKQKTAKKDSDDIKKRITRRRVKFGVAAGIFTAVSLFAVIASPILTDAFSAGNISSLAGSRISDEVLRYTIGNPHIIRRTGNEEFTVEYFGDNYLDLFEKYHDLSAQMENAEAIGDTSKMMTLLTQINALEMQAKSISYKYLGISFSGSIYSSKHSYGDDVGSNTVYYNYLEDDYYSFHNAKVTSIVLDTNRTNSDILKKGVKSVSVDSSGLLVGAGALGQVTAEIYYSDGSYIYRPLSSSELSRVDTSSVGVKTIVWEDRYGSYSATLQITNSVSGKCSMDNYSGAATVNYTVSSVEKGGYRLALSNLSDGYVNSSYVKEADWNKYKSIITDIYFDSSITDSRFVDGLDLSSYPALKTITVAENNSKYYVRNGRLYDKNGNSVW
ncbi:MAG: zinc ribbon domain-containing protein [Clostridiales bacterium]|nr:zinc ribbon domain-containing protein [Clostridiales bacterium]